MAGKKKSKEGQYSIREYAKTVPCSHVAVKNAIDEGRITGKAWDGQFIVDKEQADREFGDVYRVRKSAKSATSEPAAGTALPSLDNRSDLSAVRKETLKKILEEQSGELPLGIEMKWDGGAVPKDIDYKEALRIDMILKAEATRINNDKLIGVLVLKADVDKQLMLAGMEIRKVFERLPQRIIDAVRAATSRPEAVVIFEDELSKTLEEVAKAIEVVINGNSINS